LQTLCTLRPKRCEEVSIELLSETSLLRSRSRDETRELAAQFLGELASSDEALFLLEGIAKSSAFRNSKRVRDAAQAALDRLKTRAHQAIERKVAERKQGTGQNPTHRTGAPDTRKKSDSQVGPEAPAARTGAPDTRKKSNSQVGPEPAAARTGAGEARKKSSTTTSQVAPEPQAANDNDPSKTGPGTGRVTKPATDDKPGGATRQARSRS
jgi:hypothetical protein